MHTALKNTEDVNMVEEIKNVPEVTEEKVDTPEVTEEQEKMLAQSEVNRLVAQNKSKAKDEAKKEYEEVVNSLRAEIEEIKTSQMPEEEQLSYRQQKEEEERERRLQELTDREKELELRENALKVQSQLSEKEINQEFVHILLDTGKYKSLEDKVEAFSDIMTANNEALKQAAQKELLSGRAPKANLNTSGLTKESILAIEDTIERQKAIRENIQLFQ